MIFEEILTPGKLCVPKLDKTGTVRQTKFRCKGVLCTSYRSWPINTSKALCMGTPFLYPPHGFRSCLLLISQLQFYLFNMLSLISNYTSGTSLNRNLEEFSTKSVKNYPFGIITYALFAIVLYFGRNPVLYAHEMKWSHLRLLRVSESRLPPSMWFAKTVDSIPMI